MGPRVLVIDCRSCGHQVKVYTKDYIAKCGFCGNAWAWRELHYVRTRRAG